MLLAVAHCGLTFEIKLLVFSASKVDRYICETVVVGVKPKRARYRMENVITEVMNDDFVAVFSSVVTPLELLP